MARTIADARIGFALGDNRLCQAVVAIDLLGEEKGFCEGTNLFASTEGSSLDMAAIEKLADLIEWSLT